VPPELTFDKLEFRVYRGPELTATGTARRATFRRETSDMTAEALSVQFPARAGQRPARVDAVKATGNLRERRFQGEGGLRAEQGGQVATTSQARYAASDGLVRGDQPVEVNGGGYRLTGPGFTLDPRDQVIDVGNGAQVVTGPGVGARR
jgi:lipopolysaccharide export system protein LptC